MPALRAYKLYFVAVSALAVAWLFHALTFPPGYGLPLLTAPEWLFDALATVSNVTAPLAAIAALAMLGLVPLAWRRTDKPRWPLIVYALVPFCYLYGFLYYLLSSYM